MSKCSKEEIESIHKEMWEHFQKIDWDEELKYFAALDLKNHIIRSSPFLESYKEDIQQKKCHIGKLELEKEELESEKIQFSRNASKL
ncbi:MAG: hypothetical protein WCJ39_05960 [bacterium]